MEIKTEQKLVRLDRQYRRILRAQKRYDELKDLTKGKIIQLFELNFGHQGFEWANPIDGGSLQRQIAHPIEIDTEVVRTKLNPEQWKFIVKEIVDKDKVRKAIALNLIDRNMDGIVEKEEERLVAKGKK